MNIQTESTEDKIISATFRLIRKDGIDKVTTKKIAAEAGVNEVTIFRKFNNKQNLVDITKDHYMELFLNKMEKHLIFRILPQDLNQLEFSNCFLKIES